MVMVCIYIKRNEHYLYKLTFLDLLIKVWDILPISYVMLSQFIQMYALTNSYEEMN